MKLIDIFEKDAMTIMTATDNGNGIDRRKAEKIVDPRGFFTKNKKRIKRHLTK